MKMNSMMESAGIEIDDVRWHLATEEAKRILTYVDEPIKLAKLIHSGDLESDWYRMEERFVEDLEEKLKQRLTDVAEIEKVLRAIEAARSGRR